MKVILLSDVKKVGKKDQIIEVSDGYATNFLIPQKLALPYTERNIGQLEAHKAKAKAEDLARKEKAIANKVILEAGELSLTLAIGASGKAFGAVTAKRMEEEISKKFKIQIDRKKFINYDPINQLGSYILKVELYKDVVAEIKVFVEAK